MTAPLAHLYALALRTLDAQERRAGDLRARLAPVLAAGGVGATLLAAPAGAALVSGGALAGVVLVVTLAGLVVTIAAAWRLLAVDVRSPDIRAVRFQRTLSTRGALDDETAFYTFMIEALDADADVLQRDLKVLARLFTVVMCGILFVLCGLALAALVA